ncbi:MAG TPA: VgrG-related protein [Roseiflexaceae bacterium]|nr:VgrG-related protein [Roseiflexaceae bacterium]
MPDTERRIGQFFIQINGSDIPPAAMDALDDALVEDDLAQPAMFALRFNDPRLELIDGSLFRLGAEVTLGAADAAGRRQALLTAEITALEPAYEQHNMTLVVRGYDRSHRLHRGSKTRTFLKQGDDDIVGQIARENGLQADIQPTGTRYEYVIQDNQTDMAFLRERAARLGYQASVDGRTLRFRQADSAPQQGPALEWGVSLLSFRARFSAAAQPNEVQVRGWDPQAKRAVVGRAARPAAPSRIGDGKNGAAAAEQAFGSAATVVVSDRPVRAQDEANRIAQAVLDDMAGDYLTAEGRCLGEPGLRAGRLVQIANLGTRLSGTYFVTATRHEYTAREGYTTTFFASGRRPTSLLAALHSVPARQMTPGVVVGIVTNINDPDRLGRVKVTFPWLAERHESDWARVAAPGAGAQRGLLVLPEVDDEVLVAFEHGDLNRPYVIGGLWNGKDKPPADAVKGGKVMERTLTTRAGHRITLRDDDGAGQIEIKTGAHTIRLEDKGAGKLTIESGGDLELKGKGGKLTIGPQGVELASDAALKLKANSTAELTANASLKVQANAALEVTSSAVLNIKGSLVNIN